MIDAIGRFGAGLLAGLIPLAVLVGGVWLAIKTIGRRGDDWPDNRSCLVTGALSILYVALLLAMFGGSIEALQRHACRGADDFDLCMDPPDVDWM